MITFERDVVFLHYVARCCQWIIFVFWNNSVIQFRWSYIMIFRRRALLIWFVFVINITGHAFARIAMVTIIFANTAGLKKDNKPKNLKTKTIWMKPHIYFVWFYSNNNNCRLLTMILRSLILRSKNSICFK